MKKLFTLLILCASLFAGLPAFADFNDGLDAYNKGDYETALREWKPLAEQGDMVAQHNIGVMYRDGEGVAQDDKEAVKWFRLSADQGWAVAQFNLGNMYRNGRGVAQDNKEAVKWFRLVAEQGDAEAQGFLGLMYYYGLGVTQDYVHAHKWFNLAVSNGYAKGTELRDEIAKIMTLEQIAEAQKLASDWIAKNTNN